MRAVLKSYSTINILAVLVVNILVTAPASAEKFTIAVLPDTQAEMQTYPNNFLNRMTWLANNAALNLKYVAQVGDLVQFDQPAGYPLANPQPAHYMYISADSGFDILDAAGIPYVSCVGNHDTAAVGGTEVDGDWTTPCTYSGGGVGCGQPWVNIRNTTTLNTYFPPSRYSNLGGVYETGKMDNQWQTFSAGGLDWLVVSAELNPRNGAFAWSKTVIEAHPNHNVIYITHSFWTGSGSNIMGLEGYCGDADCASPAEVRDQLIKAYPNVKLVLSGHVGSGANPQITGNAGNTIYGFLQNWFEATRNWTRLLEIDTTAGVIRSNVYSPMGNAYKVDSTSATYTGVVWIQPAGGGDQTPSVTLTSPGNGSTVSGSVNVTATASDDHGISKVEFYVDNVLKNTDTTSPYSWSWNTTLETDASHTVKATVYDTINQTANSQAAVTVNNSGTAAFTDDFESGLGNWTLSAEAGCAAVSTTTVKHSGTKACAFIDDSATANASYMQRNLPALDPVYLRFYVNFKDDYFTVLQATAGVRGLFNIFTAAGNSMYLQMMSPTVGWLRKGATQSYWNVTLAADTWHCFEVRMPSCTANATVQWWIDGTPQPSLSGMDLAPDRYWSYPQLGNVWSNRAFMKQTVYYDDVAMSATYVGPDAPGDNPPTVSITAPANGAGVSASVNVAATAADDNGVSRVVFYVDGVSKSTDTTSPFSWSWDTNTATNAAHTVKATAFDTTNQTASAQITVTVNNSAVDAAPSVSLTAPANGATVSGTINVTANASDDQSVSRVVFYVDGVSRSTDTTSPYSWSWATSADSNASHTVKATAFDSANQTASTQVSVTVDNNVSDTLPTVAITAPAEGTEVSGTVSVRADAADDTGVTKVEFYVNDVLKHTDTSYSPYSWEWDTSVETAGTVVLKAVAYDTSNQTSNHQVSVVIKASSVVGAKVGPIPFDPISNPAGMSFSGTGVNSTLSIYTLSGKLVNRKSSLAGETMRWDGTNLQSVGIKPGLYVYVISDSTGKTKTGKIILK